MQFWNEWISPMSLTIQQSHVSFAFQKNRPKTTLESKTDSKVCKAFTSIGRKIVISHDALGYVSYCVIYKKFELHFFLT